MEVFTMALNDFLKSRIPTARKIVKKLDKEFDYISILGSYTKFKRISTNGHVSDMSDIDGECGGYNMHWALASGYVVAKSIKEKCE